MKQLRPKLAKVVGMKTFVQNVPTIRIGGSLSKSPYQYVIQGPNTEQLYQWAPMIESKLRSLPGRRELSRICTEALVEAQRNTMRER